GLRRQVGRDDGQERREAVLVVRERVAESGAGRAGLGADDQVDVRHFIAVTHEGLAEKEIRHVESSLQEEWVVRARRTAEYISDAGRSRRSVGVRAASQTSMISRTRRTLSSASRPGLGRHSCAM